MWWNAPILMHFKYKKCLVLFSLISSHMCNDTHVDASSKVQVSCTYQSFLIYKQRLVPVQCVYDMCTLRGQNSYSIKWVSWAVINCLCDDPHNRSLWRHMRCHRQVFKLHSRKIMSGLGAPHGSPWSHRSMWCHQIKLMTSRIFTPDMWMSTWVLTLRYTNEKLKKNPSMST